MLRNIVIAFFLSMLSFGSMAATTLDTKGLSEQQILELQLQAAKLREAKPEVSVDDINNYTEVGKNIATAFIAVASELGKSVDELLTTTTGKLIMFLIVWKVAGEDLFGIVAAFFWCVVMIPAWMYYFRKFCVNYEYQYHENGKVSSKHRRGANDNAVGIFIVAAMVIVVVPMFMAFVG